MYVTLKAAGGRVISFLLLSIGELLICPEFCGFSVSCYDEETRDLVILFVHLITTLVRLAGPGGVRSVVAESLLAEQQLLILNRSRQRSPNLRVSDRIIAGLCALLIRRARLMRSCASPELRAPLK
jgi:hypothetical protein